VPPIKFHPTVDDVELFEGIASIRAEMDLATEHDPRAEAEALVAARRGPVAPPGSGDGERLDARDIHLVAIDPAGSRDLDQAFGAERRGAGYRVHYAIADVAAFVTPGSVLESSSLNRGVTLYAPDGRISLHPDVLNEDAASLLPRVDRPCLLWQLDLDSAAQLESANMRRATVRVAEAISYHTAQAEIDGDAPRESLELLAEIGPLRQQLERERGAVSLDIPAQEVTRNDLGIHTLVYDEALPVEGWNAQMSLMTGMAAGQIMHEAGIGVLRTLPTPDPETVEGLRRTAGGLGIDWPDTVSYADLVRDLDPNIARERTMLVRSARGLSGAGYASFLDHDSIPSHPQHSAIAALYGHVTAPLRRVCDRYANEVILAIGAGRTPPDWALATLPDLPSVMGRSRQRASKYERAVLDLVEVLTLEDHVGREFEALVVNHRREKAVIQIAEPAIVTEIEPKAQLGQRIRVRLRGVDIEHRRLHFERLS
jgi:exoribonuclease R